MDDVCLVIPSTHRHAQHLKTLIPSIEKQTFQPKEIVVALSEADEETCKYWNTVISEMTNLGIEVDCVAKKAYAAENRNRGGRHCNSNIISFMDADDTMSHDRLESVVTKMNEYDADALLHNFKMNETCPKSIGKVYTADTLRNLHNRQKNDNGPLHLAMNPMPHHGHISIKKHVFDHLKQDESEQFRRGEDSEYVRRIIDHGYDTIFTDQCLSDYHIEHSTSMH